MLSRAVPRSSPALCKVPGTRSSERELSSPLPQLLPLLPRPLLPVLLVLHAEMLSRAVLRSLPALCKVPGTISSERELSSLLPLLLPLLPRPLLPVLLVLHAEMLSKVVLRSLPVLFSLPGTSSSERESSSPLLLLLPLLLRQLLPVLLVPHAEMPLPVVLRNLLMV